MKGLNVTSRSQKHRMVWVVRDFKDYLVPTSLPYGMTFDINPNFVLGFATNMIKREEIV